MVFPVVTFYYGCYGVVIVWENDPEIQTFRESVLTAWYSALCGGSFVQLLFQCKENLIIYIFDKKGYDGISHRLWIT